MLSLTPAIHRRRQSRAHAVPIRIFFGGLENVPVARWTAGGKVFCPGAPIGMYCADDRGRRIVSSRRGSVFHDCFNSHGAGDFAVGFAPHAVGKHEEVERLDDLVTIFVFVRTRPISVTPPITIRTRTPLACSKLQHYTGPARVPGNAVPTLTEAQAGERL